MSKPLIHRAVRTARAVRAVAARPPYVTPGHYYSPLTADADLDRAMSWTGAPGVDLAEERQLALAARLEAVLDEPFPGPRYTPGNRFYGAADAAIYRAMLGHLRPSRLLEVGSGYSTALALDEADANQSLSGLEITCIEPFPERMLSVITEADRDRLTLIRQPVQDAVHSGPGSLRRLHDGPAMEVIRAAIERLEQDLQHVEQRVRDPDPSFHRRLSYLDRITP